jgi:hypothetical protein
MMSAKETMDSITNQIEKMIQRMSRTLPTGREMSIKGKSAAEKTQSGRRH